MLPGRKSLFLLMYISSPETTVVLIAFWRDENQFPCYHWVGYCHWRKSPEGHLPRGKKLPKITDQEELHSYHWGKYRWLKKIKNETN